jgi:phage repressor protein C with HTH and peptisase S24 domain
MALNPIAFTEKVVSDFLKYQLTTYPLADKRLHDQMRAKLNLDVTRDSPLLKGPYISLSRSFAPGATLKQLAKEGLIHKGLESLSPHPSVRGHQEDAFRAIHAKKTTLVSTGTGSGKTECFLYPIISRCLELRDAGAAPGITAVLVYPMNALAEDQLDRLRELLCGTGITYGLYVGKTPERRAEVTGQRLKPGSSKADYLAQRDEARKQKITLHPPEELCSREEMRETPPRILLTNVKQLELLLTRSTDLELFDGALLDFLVFDEAHTYSGAQGAETACLIRRLRAYCGKKPHETVCVATSATIADPVKGPDAGRDFASRFFGLDRENVALVGERYEADPWSETRQVPPPLAGDIRSHLKHVLEAVEDPDESASLLRGIYQGMTGQRLSAKACKADLYDRLSENELVYQLAKILEKPQRLSDLLTELEKRLGREVSEEELLIWLALGAAATKDSRPRLRPVLHGFVRGVGGAVVTFPENAIDPVLHLSSEEAQRHDADEPLFPLPLKVCTTCGQHYFTQTVKDFRFDGKRPSGGDMEGDGVVWKPLDAKQDGVAVTLYDRLVSEEDSDDEPAGAALYFCRHCGALHPEMTAICRACARSGALVRLMVVKPTFDKQEGNSGKTKEGRFSRCLSCNALGRRFQGRFREPARPIRAVTVSDVHVLAQTMIHNAERKRLLLFSDNRQDAAFQAGWMQDHARRFRLRSLLMNAIPESGISIGDLAMTLDKQLDRDDSFSKALLPEVWRDTPKEKAGTSHAENRRSYLRIQILRELATSPRQRIGLEPWGRLRVTYRGLDESLPFIQSWAQRLGLEPARLVDGVAAILDHARRKRIFFDSRGKIFSRWWQEGDREIQYGYLPFDPNGPTGLRLSRRPSDNKNRVAHWFGSHPTTISNAVRSWGVPEEDVDGFLTECWSLCTEKLQLLVPVTLTGFRDKPLPGCDGLVQVDADQLWLTPHAGVFRCRKCRVASVRSLPHDACMSWRCGGSMQLEAQDPDNYDLYLLDADVEMIRAREHSAQVPTDDRESIENLFKGDSDAINTLVCTPTLELGVDIGNLDGVLMRNVPPRPANYFQRAGRAGRRHRMAVNLTYARPASHDQAYFADPLKLLLGQVDPPRFNLRNPLMVAKHVRAAVLTILFGLAREGSSLSADERNELSETLRHVFPKQTKDYLFDENGHIRSQPLDVSSLGIALGKHNNAVERHVLEIFGAGWPQTDAETVSPAALKKIIVDMSRALTEVLWTLKKRLDWATGQMDRLDKVRKLKAVLDADEDAMYERCERLVKKLKGVEKRRSRDAEGYDDTNTYAALAAEGFLPGYGLETGSVRGTASIPRYLPHAREYVLPRPPAVALREYFPGNIIYANGHRFIPRFHQLGTDKAALFQVDTQSGSVVELGIAQNVSQAISSTTLQAVEIADVIMPHQSHISDEEEYRFQPPAAVYGYERDRHGPGTAFDWNGLSLLHRTSLYLRLVNVGATAAMEDGRLGFPICGVCGQSRSPFSSVLDLEGFSKDHSDRCGITLTANMMPFTGLYAEVVADSFTFQQLAGQEEAYTLGELLRRGASEVLDMELDDLHLLVIGKAGTPEVDLMLYDPMPGGSGLLEQMRDRWAEVITAAQSFAENCPSLCERACVDCLLTFRNAFYHRHLNRQAGGELLATRGISLTERHAIPAKLPRTAAETGLPQTALEERFKHMLVRAGFPDPICQHPIRLGKPYGDTIPDFFYEGADEDEPGVAIFVDGMSGHIHGNPETADRDQQLRDYLRSQEYEVLTVPSRDLDDAEQMTKHFRKLAKALQLNELRAQIKEDTSWFESSRPSEVSPASQAPASTTPAAPSSAPSIIRLPLLSLRAAAGGFGDHGDPEVEDWLNVPAAPGIKEDMFLVRVVGHSMEPTIPNGSLCVFKGVSAGSRMGKVVLAQHRDISDVDNDGGNYTVKRYRSIKRQTEEGWVHESVSLEPDNRAYPVMSLDSTEDNPVRIVAEFVMVLA